ncbi:MAG: hypothetical protein PVTTEEND_001830 [Candidatus Fervidibacter sp.]|jgi:Glycosyl transferases group 1.
MPQPLRPSFQGLQVGASMVPIRIGMDGLLVPDLPALTQRVVGQFLFTLHHFDRFNEYLLYTPQGGTANMAIDCQLPYWKVVATKVPHRPAFLRRLVHQSAFRFVADRDGLDLVHALTPISPFAATNASLDEAPPVIVSVWDEPAPSRWLDASFRQARRIAVASRWLAQQVRERYGVPSEKLRVMPVGVDPLFVAEAPATFEPTKVLVWGETPAWVQEALKQLGADWQMLPSDVSPTEAKEALSDASIVIVTQSDARGSQGLNALAMKRFVIAVPHPPLKEVLNEAAIWLDEETPTALKRAMERLRDEAPLRRRLLSRADELVARRQWMQAVKAWIGLYRRTFEETVAEFVGWELPTQNLKVESRRWRS